MDLSNGTIGQNATPATAAQIDVAIVGAGPVGLMLAAVLGQSGVKTRVFERRLTPHSEPRAIAYDADTLRLFQTVGAYEALAPSLELDVPVSFFSGSGKLLMRATRFGRPYGHSQMGTLYQPELEAAIKQTVDRHASVEVHMGVQASILAQDEEGVTLALQSDGDTTPEATIRARYVVACDGGASRTRQGLGISFDGSTYGEKWLVVDTEGDDLGIREMHFYCDPRRPALTVPVSKNRRRWEFLIMPGDDEDEIQKEPVVRQMMAGYGGGKARHIERSTVYTFHSRMADRFREGRVFLAGDAAHVMPPFAGQGMNSGLRDAANLGWKLAAVCSGRAREELLSTYEVERRKHVTSMTKLAEFLGTVVMPTSRAGAALRDSLCRGLMSIPPVRKKFDDGAIVPEPSITKTALLNRRAGKKVGTMIPQPEMTDGRDTFPMDSLLGPGFSLLGIGCDVHEVLSEADIMTAAKLQAQTVSINVGLAPREIGDALTKWVGGKPTVILLRPDRFVADVIPRQAKPYAAGRLDWLSKSHSLI